MTQRDAVRLDQALDHARQVADAILYEGYLLYPYRASAQKNQERFQFGVLMPPGYAQVDPGEPAASQTECILEPKAATELTVRVRFLQLRRRTVLAAPVPVILDADALTLRENCHALYYVSKFASIPRPGVILQYRVYRFIHGALAEVVARAEFVEKVSH